MPSESPVDRRIDAARGATTREWEVFVRESEADPLTHVGSLSAPTVDVAHDQATRLFDWTAEALWLCPTDEVARFQSAALSLDPDAEASDA